MKRTSYVLDPWSSELPSDYKHLMEEFGIKPITEDLKKRMPDSHLIRRGILFAQRDLGRIVKAYEEGEEFAILTGVKPSNVFHLGSKLVADVLKFFQEMNGRLFYAVADIEAYHANKQSLEKSAEIAVDNIADLLALGVSEKNSYFYKQSQEEEVMRNGYLYARNVTNNTLKAVYGDKEIGLYMSALVQVGDILLPESEKFGGPKPVIVPVGIDQDPHIRLTRDIAAKHRLVRPSSVYTKFMRSLTGSEKMSKSEPMGMISLNDDEKTVEVKVMRAFTGGRVTVEEQREKGGEPLKCVVFELFKYHLEEDDKKLEERFRKCVNGEIMCGECKKQAAQRLKEFLRKHQEKKKKMIPKARKLLEKK